MELTVLTKEQYQEIINRLDAINEKFKKIEQPASEKFMDNAEFLSLMKVSKRTAQTWRDEGKISFSQVGNKIYYSLSDVEALLKHHYIKAFNPSFRTRVV
jgi:hypothetical protein